MDAHLVGDATAHVDLDGPTARALRTLQVLDQLDTIPHRALLLEAESALGEALSVSCTGVEEGGGFYDHSGETCPVHEWLCPAVDYGRARKLGGG